MNNRFSKFSLSQQLALVAASCALLVSLVLVAVATTSSQHIQQSQQAGYGRAMAQQIARRISSALETGDLLSIAASLQRFVETSSAEQVAIFDVEGTALGQAGTVQGRNAQLYRAPVRIESDVAGEVVITLGSDATETLQQRLLLSLVGLAVLLSLVVYGVCLRLGQNLSRRLVTLARDIALEETATARLPANEIQLLRHHVNALPMELLRTRSARDPREEDYRDTAVLYLHLTSLVGYVDTLDEHSLHRYTDRLHHIVYASAGFYGGRIQVMRQFGLALYFSTESGSESSAGSAAFRAASCAWLVRAVCQELEQQMSLSLQIAMAVAHSELGVGDESDIYPGLYMQHTLDELQGVCASKPPQVMLSPAVCNDVDINGRLEHRPSELGGYAILEAFEAPYSDLLERQLRLILRRLGDPVHAHA